MLERGRFGEVEGRGPLGFLVLEANKWSCEKRGEKALILTHLVFSEGKISVLEESQDLSSDWGVGSGVMGGGMG